MLPGSFGVMDEDLATAADEPGLNFGHACDDVCGTCLCGVLDGEPDHHRDVDLSAAEKASGNLMMPCVSRARGDSLILDL